MEYFITQAQEIVREWVVAAVAQEDTHPEYTNKISMICDLANKVLNVKDDEENEERESLTNPSIGRINNNVVC